MARGENVSRKFMDINVICLFPEELKRALDCNCVLQAHFRTVDNAHFMDICNMIILIYVGEYFGSITMDDEFYIKYKCLEFSKLEGKEFVRLVGSTLSSLGAAIDSVSILVKRLDMICRYLRKFKSFKRDAMLGKIEDLLKNSSDLNKYREKLLHDIRILKENEDRSSSQIRLFNIFKHDNSSSSSFDDDELTPENLDISKDKEFIVLGGEDESI
jgi:hypothetical protein